MTSEGASEPGGYLWLYVAAYSDPSAAETDWDAIKELAKQKVIAVDGLVFVNRDADGKIHEEDNVHVAGVGATVGMLGGLLVGLIFPPSLLVAGAVGAGIGAGLGGLISHEQKEDIKAAVSDDIQPGSSGIVVLFEPRWVADVEKALPKATSIAKHKVDKPNPDQAKDKAAGAT